MLGLVNGCFYAMLSLGLAIIFGMLNIINFAHGALYMMGAVFTWIALTQFGISYWWSLLLVPLVIALFGVVVERTMLRRLYKLDNLYGLLLTFGIALVMEGFFRHRYGVSGTSLFHSGCVRGSIQPGIHVPAEIPRVGHRRLAADVLCHLVRD